jgi:uncharacterized protein (TIGR02646 family)
LKKIVKRNEPRSLTTYRSQIPSQNILDENIYDDFPYKTKEGCKNNETDNLRKSLLEEQGYICCYCMSRISCDNSKIEHFKPQSPHRDKQIEYSNLFISCNDGEGKNSANQHCDTKKGNRELRAIDLLDSIENHIIYNKKADKIEIDSQNDAIKNDLAILNLNVSRLQKNRKESYDNVIQRLKQKGFSIQNIKRILNYYKSKHNGKYEPFCEMIVYFLTKKLKQQGVTL